MNVVFLDFDGVLNSTSYLNSLPDGHPEKEGMLGLDPVNVAHLNHLVRRPLKPPGFVVTSTWRKGRTTKELQEILYDKGFLGLVVGKTPCLAGKSRGFEIQTWLTESDLYGVEVDNFVVLDDEENLAPVSDRVIKTDYYHGGLLDSHVSRAIEMLKQLRPLLVMDVKGFVP
jgi:hypothetical protein